MGHGDGRELGGLAAIRRSVNNGIPFGSESWARNTAKQICWSRPCDQEAGPRNDPEAFFRPVPDQPGYNAAEYVPVPTVFGT